MFEPNVSKIMTVSYAIILTAINVPLSIIIISYHKNRYRRTLINKLWAGAILCLLVFQGVSQLPLIALFASGPLPWIICQAELVMFPTLIGTFFLLLSCVSIVRYLFIFKLKNPTVTQDNFWSVFLVVWLILLLAMANYVNLALPGRNIHFDYICWGKISPDILQQKDSKGNPIIVLTFLFCLITNSFIFLKYKMFLRKGKKFTSGRKNIATLTLCFLTAIKIGLLSVLPVKIYSMDLQNVIEYPNYILIFIYFLVVMPTAVSIFLLLLLVQSQDLRNFTRKRFSSLLLIAKFSNDLVISIPN
jgi:hypothetical protein